jgi:hypothetical protein
MNALRLERTASPQRKPSAGIARRSRRRDHALSVHEPYGIWGGLSEEKRAERLGLYSLRYPARIADSATQQSNSDN